MERELSYSQAKAALMETPNTINDDGSVSTRIETVRTLRDQILGVKYRGNIGTMVIETNVSYLIALAYLGRLGWQIEMTDSGVRFRENSAGQLVEYVRIDAINPEGSVEGGGGRIVLFAPNSGQSVEPQMKMFVPPSISLANKALENGGEMGSVTNVVVVNPTAMLVYKIFPVRWLGGILSSGKGRLTATDLSPEKARREYEMLRLLSKTGIPTPRVLGYSENDACLVLELETGQPLSQVVLDGSMTESIMVDFAIFLADVHQRLAPYADDVSQFPIPNDHTANAVVNFREGVRRLKNDPHDWLRNISAPLSDLYCKRVEEGISLLPQYERCGFFPQPIYGDAKDENVLTRWSGEGYYKFALIDPVLCMGRRSMDIAKFLRSILIKDFSAFKNFHRSFMDAYNCYADASVDPEEVAHMLALDLLNISRSYLTIPEEKIGLFPPFVNDFRAQAEAYLSIVIPNLLQGSFEF